MEIGLSAKNFKQPEGRIPSTVSFKKIPIFHKKLRPHQEIFQKIFQSQNNVIVFVEAIT